MAAIGAILVSIALTRVSVNSKQASCSKARTFIITEGQVLSGHALSTHQVTSSPECNALCIQHPRCLSYNYQYISTSSGHMCEINDATAKMCPNNMVRREKFSYYEDKDATCSRRCPPSDSNETNFQLSFPTKTVHDFVRFDLKSCASPLTAFTVCLWIKSNDQSDDGALFSYSLPDEGNEILVIDYSSLKLVINNEQRRIEAAVNDDQWHHICATWENTAGSWNFYIDGTRVANGDKLETGHVVINDGIVILGQDQDNYGGGFEQMQSFFGEMYGVNMWNSALSSEEIFYMARSCSYGVGNYLRWSDFVTGLHGNVGIVSPSTCSP